MTDYSAIKAKLLDKQQELSNRLKTTQATEGHEVEEGLGRVFRIGRHSVNSSAPPARDTAWLLTTNIFWPQKHAA